MNVVTVWWADEGRGRYSRAYPEALKSQLSDLGFELTVLTDTEHGRPLRQPLRYRGWWAKLECFAPWNEDLRPLLCVDLDTFIVRDIRPILGLDPTKLWLIRQFLTEKRLGESGLFVAPKDCDAIWREAEQLTRFDKGDGDFLRKFPHSFIPDVVSGIYSYKAHCRNGLPRDARICCFHGKPRPHEAGGWAQEWFERHAARHSR